MVTVSRITWSVPVKPDSFADRSMFHVSRGVDCTSMSRPAGADWDAARYHRVAQPHAAWGASVLERLQVRGDEVVLDAGCGSGRVTEQLLERLPRGRVIAVDRSPAMLAEARAALEGQADRVTFVQADLLQLDAAVPVGSVDAVLSTATFHWIDDHARLFAAIRAVLRAGGQLVSQYGGGTNLAEFMAATDDVVSRPPFAEHFGDRSLWRFYSTPEQTRLDLERAGFSHIETWLEPSPQTFADARAFGDFARTVVLRNHVAALAESELQDTLVAAVADAMRQRLGAYALDYVRLNTDAVAA
jgi:trans-aconitate 2-methyltransferase